jgi:hypothetical protein
MHQGQEDGGQKTRAIKFVIILSAMELFICFMANVFYGFLVPASVLIFLPFLVFNVVALKILPENWTPSIIVFLSVVFLGALDNVTSYQVVNAASIANETNFIVKPILGNPLNYTILKMAENTFSATIIFALMTMGRSDTMRKAGYAAGVLLVMFMMFPPVNNFIVMSMML